MMWIFALFVFAVGTIVGSFVNVVIERTIAGEDWIRARSRCDNCKKVIAWYDNIPLLSYLLLG
jgi:leader peptidase (prepilin peptidase) / N-methyltransferase